MPTYEAGPITEESWRDRDARNFDTEITHWTHKGLTVLLRCRRKDAERILDALHTRDAMVAMARKFAEETVHDLEGR